MVALAKRRRVEPLDVRRSADRVALARVRETVMPIRLSAQVAWAGVFGAVQILQGLSALVHRGFFDGFGYVQIAIGLAFPPLTILVYRHQWLAMPSEDGRVAIDDAGLTLRPEDETIPWRLITNVRDVGEAFVFSRRMGRPFALFKADLPDEGRALWRALEVRLVATTYLVRGTSSRTTITNTAVRARP